MNLFYSSIADCAERCGSEHGSVQFRWSQVAIATCLGLGALGGAAPGAIANPLTQGELVAQQIVEGLPPPPPAIGIPTAPTLQASSDNLYLVYVNGDSPLLLDQVRRVSTEASLQDYQGQQVIQAGVFEEPTYAQQQVSALEQQGILAEVAEVPSAWFAPAVPAQATVQVPVQPAQVIPVQTAAAPATIPPPELIPATVAPREIEFGVSPSVAAVTTVSPAATLQQESSHFYVVIPGRSDELSDISAQVIRLGANFGIAGSVEERTAPVGPHVRVGPFANETAADRWSEFFNDFGLNARVYYNR